MDFDHNSLQILHSKTSKLILWAIIDTLYYIKKRPQQNHVYIFKISIHCTVSIPFIVERDT